MPTENENKVSSLIDVGEADEKAAEINLDDKGEPEKVEAPAEDKIEVEEVSNDKTYENERETKLEKKDEVQEYSEGVQKRIAKLTRKMREAERQKEEAIAFAESTNKQKSELEGRLSKLDKSYTSEFETRVKTNMAAARQALKTAIESQDVEGQIAAQEQIANLTMDGARLNAMKAAEESKPKEVKVKGFIRQMKCFELNQADHSKDDILQMTGKGFEVKINRNLTDQNAIEELQVELNKVKKAFNSKQKD